MVRTIVCAKQVYDVEGLKVDPKTRSLITERVERKISDFDKNALEEALRIREKHGGSVTVVTLGPPTANVAAKEALNMGADDAYVICGADMEQLDARATSDMLAAAIRRIGEFDLVICGDASIDMYSGQVGPRLAERLGIPQVSHAKKVTVNGSVVTAERDLEEADETVEAPMPVLLTVTKEINEPRIPTISMFIKASKKTVKTLDTGELGVPFATSVKVLKALAPMTERRREAIEGKPAEIAESLARQLLREGVVDG
ncbi:MAG: electron transfer flavoprotein subunit beta/FixA family protein [Nitrososphaerales archaeon]|jgi:electron transfer flavoprotein beta subunit